MGNVIEGRFGGKKESKTSLTIERAAVLAPKLMETKIFVQSLLNTDPLAQKRVDAQHPLVAGYSDEELARWIADSGETEWRAKPFFFSALCDELKMRCDVVADSVR